MSKMNDDLDYGITFNEEKAQASKKQNIKPQYQ